MLNSVNIQGRLVKTPELKYTRSGDAYTRFSIAVDAPYTKANGERETYFFDVIAWRKQAEFACNYLTQGRLVVVEGKLTASTYTDNNGIKRKSVDIDAEHLHFCDSKPKTEQTAPQYPREDFAAGYEQRSAAPPASPAPPPPPQNYGPAAPPQNYSGPAAPPPQNYGPAAPPPQNYNGQTVPPPAKSADDTYPF